MTATRQESSTYDHLWTDIYGDMQRTGPAHAHHGRLVRRLLADLDYRSVLDVGCGPGWNIGMLTAGRTLDSVAGVDISETAVEQARRIEPRAEFHVHDVQSGPLRGRWDLVYCALTIHLVPDDVAALRSLYQNTAKYLVISTIAGDFERYKSYEVRLGAVRNYRRGELEDKLTRTGFRVRQAIYWGCPFYSPLGRSLQNLSGVGTGSYGWGARLAAKAMNALYYLNSSRRGDLLIVVAEV